ncbi:Hypothetical predicted protein [Pelobates cultripes]|uniref:Uncharacterized protein n=2 Tax=Pelobates cultripes TaxID=61616 RepID=A0AAD1WRS7_PELCU|nr:Hypothetical predicted protein [Pelobates cultripes]
MALSRNIDTIRSDRKSFMGTWSTDETYTNSNEPALPPKDQRKDIRSFIHQLGKLMEREVQIWWDIATLDFYVNNNIVPRGLRLFKRSTYKRHDPTLLKKWDQLLDKGSLLLMVFLINEKKKDLTQLDQEITQLKSTIRPLVENGDYVELLDTIERRVKDIEMNIRENKRKKIMRDQADYKTQTQRNWKKDQTLKYQPPQRYGTELRYQRQVTFRDTDISQRTPNQSPTKKWMQYRPTHYRGQHHRGYRPSQDHRGYRPSQYTKRGHTDLVNRQYMRYQRRDWHTQGHGHQYTPTAETPTFDQIRSDSNNVVPRETKSQPTTHTENDFLDKRGRIPPKRFAMEDFRSPELRKKRSIRETEEDPEQQEEVTQLKRRK